MTPAAHLQATIILLGEIDNLARPADAIVSGWFRMHRTMDEHDRGAVLELLYAVLRHRARLGWWLERNGRTDTPRSRMIAFLALINARTPDQANRLFNGAKFAPVPLNDDEHALLTELQDTKIDHPDMPTEVRVECPDWALEPLRRRFGDAFETELLALLTPPTLDLRVNTLKTTRDAIMGELDAVGLRAEKMRMAPHGVRIAERISLTRLDPLKTGEIAIQDEGAQMVAMLVDARPGNRVVDFCAGAAGKTLAMAAQMNNKGHIVACDVNESRLKRGTERIRNAGVHNAETRLLSSEMDRWVKRHKGGFDRVLVDAPCSGTGTWRRNPDARWRTPEEKGLGNLIALQGRILASAARLVKPGGRLVYATCSMLIEENEDQITAFLAAHPAFHIVPLHEAAPQFAELGHGDYLSLTPARHDTDGFFAAALQKEAAAPIAQTA